MRNGDLVNRHKQSVDLLLGSVAKHVGQNAHGIIMNGKGKDGAEGLLQMKTAGAKTIAQDEKSSVVFGIPKEAIKLGVAVHVLSLQDMPLRVVTLIKVS